ncbi:MULTISPECIES: alpha/beta hydrolase [unclassified Nocardioides]|uniref:alpha/beta hydrolase n=1 Tax=unclassified Nocardioides TaxID=2615069 RepID=UPI00301526D7
MFNNLRARTLLLGLVGGLLVALPAAPAAAGDRDRAPRIVSRAVTFSVVNRGPGWCAADGGTHQVRGRLVGTRAAVEGRTGARRLNILVHDFAAGSWFWHLRSHPAYDYATQLARRGEVSLVLDRLGYGASPLADGRATCLGAQAETLHQVVQRVRSGLYSFSPDRDTRPLHAASVVLHGHSVGAAIAQLEAGTHDDVDGLVLMSWADSGASTRAVRAASAQVSTCLRGADYATYGGGAAAYRALMFRTAPVAVQRSAVRRRSADPCGDATSLAPALLPSALAARKVDAPVLLLVGSADVRVRPGAAERQARSYPRDVAVTTRTIPGAASALPLERSAPATRRTVLRWLRALR